MLVRKLLAKNNNNNKQLAKLFVFSSSKKNHVPLSQHVWFSTTQPVSSTGRKDENNNKQDEEEEEYNNTIGVKPPRNSNVVPFSQSVGVLTSLEIDNKTPPKEDDYKMFLRHLQLMAEYRKESAHLKEEPGGEDMKLVKIDELRKQQWEDELKQMEEVMNVTPKEKTRSAILMEMSDLHSVEATQLKTAGLKNLKPRDIHDGFFADLNAVLQNDLDTLARWKGKVIKSKEATGEEQDAPLPDVLGGRRAEKLYRKYLLLLESKTIASIALEELIRLVNSEPQPRVSYTNLCLGIGQEIREFAENVLNNHAVDLYGFTNKKENQIATMEEEEAFFSTTSSASSGDAWRHHEDDLHLGSFLVKRMVDCLSVPGKEGQREKALSHAVVMSARKRLRGWVQLHEQLNKPFHEMYTTDKALLQDLPYGERLRGSRYYPMRSPPLQWRRGQQGGYLTDRGNKSSMVRTRDSLHMRALYRANLAQIFRGIDTLGGTAWRVNEEVHALVEECKRVGIACGKLELDKRKADRRKLRDQQAVRKVVEESKMLHVLVKEVEEVDPARRAGVVRKHEAVLQHIFGVTPEQVLSDEQLLYDMKKKKRDERIKAVAKLEATQAECSRGISANIAFDTASKYKTGPIWFPYMLDFRGRAYPLAGALTPVGDDMNRALIKFAKAKPLGERGYFWLKVHLANLFGVNKVSLEDRCRWTEEHMDDVTRAATMPIDEANRISANQWWAGADEPLQAFATCVEIHNARASGNPHTYQSCLPVHQDGSCNGLQHYAALGRDSQGAKAVNLCTNPSGFPADVYSEIAALVGMVVNETAERDFDAKWNDVIEGEIRRSGGVVQLEKLNQEFKVKYTAYLADKLKDKITRKLIKQTVMTSVYGVTRVGARDQIQKQVEASNEESKDLRFRNGPLIQFIPEDLVFSCSQYLAGVTIDAIGSKFLNAKQIMDWLQACAGLIAKTNSPVSWMTPLGLPVVQPYRKERPKLVSTYLQEVSLHVSHQAGPIDRLKQRAAFPPNYVHSLDSSHMFLTALKCRERKIEFASVHDSFWTHAADVDEMGRVLRESFIELHSQNLLEDLKQQFTYRFPQINFPPPPERGDFELSKVKDSPYFFN